MYFRTNSKIIAFITMIAMIFTLVTPVLAAQVSDFTDFPAGWSKDAMTHAVANGILNGRTSSTINPKDNLTRAEMAAIVNRAFGATVKADISHLTDVSKSDWYYDEIAKAVNMRTFQGDSASTMNPDSYITREQVFVAIGRALVLSSEDYSSLLKFNDGNLVSDWAKSASSALVINGYLNGDDKGNLKPQNYITREEFAQLIYNLIKVYCLVPGEVTSIGFGNILIRTSGVTLKNITIEGDLIIGDGVGNGTVILDNVIIKGRLLCRGGEGGIKIISSKVYGGVVINDVNGTVHFENLRSEDVFDNIILNTPATFKEASVGGGGSSGGGNSGGVETYYTVSFHNGATASVFDTVNINQSIPAENRTLSYVGKNLDTIYAGKLDTTGQTYDRSDISYTGLGATYTHTVGKEFIYKKSNGIWDVFTNSTPVNGNIDVYYGQKHIVAEVDKQVFGINPVLEISYDSQSRFFDTLKDGMISAGLTLSQTDVKNEINSKIQAAFNKANAKTGMVDSQGNILDKDYGLKIVDVIDYDQINAEVNTKIQAMLNGSEEELRSVVSLIDMATIVDNIGGRTLIESVGIPAIRSELKSNDYKLDGITYIQDKIKGDINVPSTLQESVDIIEKVLSSSTKDALVDTAASNNAFIIELLGINSFRAQILEVVTKEHTAANDAFISNLDKPSVRNEIIAIIRSDASFNDILTSQGWNSLPENDVNDALVDFVKDYLNRDTTIHADIKTLIENNIIKFIENYFNGVGTLATNPDIIALVGDIKTPFIAKIKEAAVNDIITPVANFIQTPANANFVDSFVADKYENILDAVDDNFIMDYLGGLSDEKVDALVVDYATVDMIVNHIMAMDPDTERPQFAQTIVSFLDNYTPFLNFMNSFKNKDEFFKVNIDNIHFVSAVGEAINGFDFDEILTILRDKGYGNIIDFLGEDIVEDMFMAAKADYWNGLRPVIDAVKGDNVEREYTTSLTVTINAPLILHGIYINYSGKFANTIKNNNIYKYNENTSLKKLVEETDWFNVFLGYDSQRINDTTGATGYYFKDFMQYYTSMLDAFILYDQALCFYNTQNCTEEELILVKKSLTKDFVKFIKKLEELSDNVENGRPIVGSYTLSDLIARVDSLKTVVDSLGGTPVGGYEDTIKSVVDNVKQILTDLGEGNLPNGYTFDDLQALCDRLNSVIDAMNTGDYDSANASFETLINNSISKLASIISELDTDGTIAGRPLDAIFSKISVINEIYSQYEDEFKDIISSIADMDIDSIDISVSLEKFEDIIFGREEENIFNADTVVNIIGSKLTPSSKDVIDTSVGKYIIDKYSKSIVDYTATLERNFY